MSIRSSERADTDTLFRARQFLSDLCNFRPIRGLIIGTEVRGYHYSDSIIYGFSHTHLSGTGIPDYCDILFAAICFGEPQFFGRKAKKIKTVTLQNFRTKTKKPKPGYYSVLTRRRQYFSRNDGDKKSRFSSLHFSRNRTNANIILDLKWRDEVLDSDLKIVGNNRIEGFRRSRSWAKDQVVYFVAEFSKPFSRKFEMQKIVARSNKRQTRHNQRHQRSHFRFKTKANEQILLKVAISPVSIEGARKNLEAEIPDWDFEKVRNDAKKAWNKELSKIEVSGGTDAQMTNFYTALYHTMIAPNIFQDVDGNYLGLDKKIHNLNETIQNPKSKIQNRKLHDFLALGHISRRASALYDH